MRSCVDVPIGKGVTVGCIKYGGTQRDIDRNRLSAVRVSHAESAPRIKQWLFVKVWGGGCCRRLLDALRICISSFASRGACYCDVAIIVLCMCRSAQSLVY